MRVLAFALSLTFFLGCAAATKHVKEDPAKGALLFPYGSYIHQVRLNVPTNPDPSKRTFEFRGAVKIAPEIIRIAVLSPVGTTLFKMSEDRATGKVTIENFVPSLKPYEGKLADYYASLRVLLTTPRRPEGSGFTLDRQGRPLLFETGVAERPTKFEFADYDEHEIPTSLRISSDAFTVDVKVLGYEL
jgi:hypothetical protein